MSLPLLTEEEVMKWFDTTVREDFRLLYRRLLSSGGVDLNDMPFRFTFPRVVLRILGEDSSEDSKVYRETLKNLRNF